MRSVWRRGRAVFRAHHRKSAAEYEPRLRQLTLQEDRGLGKWKFSILIRRADHFPQPYEGKEAPDE